MSFAATDPTYCRLTVLGPRIRVDVALPADLPVAELVPMVLELVGEPVFGVRPQPWRLFRVTGAPLPLGESLHELGVLEGDLLRIAPDRRPQTVAVGEWLALKDALGPIGEDWRGRRSGAG